MSEKIPIFNSYGNLTEEAYEWIHNMDREELQETLQTIFMKGYDKRLIEYVSNMIDEGIIGGKIVPNPNILDLNSFMNDKDARIKIMESMGEGIFNATQDDCNKYW